MAEEVDFSDFVDSCLQGLVDDVKKMLAAKADPNMVAEVRYRTWGLNLIFLS